MTTISDRHKNIVAFGQKQEIHTSSNISSTRMSLENLQDLHLPKYKQTFRLRIEVSLKVFMYLNLVPHVGRTSQFILSL